MDFLQHLHEKNFAFLHQIKSVVVMQLLPYILTCVARTVFHRRPFFRAKKSACTATTFLALHLDPAGRTVDNKKQQMNFSPRTRKQRKHIPARICAKRKKYPRAYIRKNREINRAVIFGTTIEALEYF